MDFIDDTGFSEEPKVTVCKLVEGLYEVKEYRGCDQIESELFRELALSAEQVINFDKHLK